MRLYQVKTFSSWVTRCSIYATSSLHCKRSSYSTLQQCGCLPLSTADAEDNSWCRRTATRREGRWMRRCLRSVLKRPLHNYKGLWWACLAKTHPAVYCRSYKRWWRRQLVSLYVLAVRILFAPYRSKYKYRCTHIRQSPTSSYPLGTRSGIASPLWECTTLHQ